MNFIFTFEKECYACMISTLIAATEPPILPLWPLGQMLLEAYQEHIRVVANLIGHLLAL